MPNFEFEESLDRVGEYWQLKAAVRAQTAMRVDLLSVEQHQPKVDTINRALGYYGTLASLWLEGHSALVGPNQSELTGLRVYADLQPDWDALENDDVHAYTVNLTERASRPVRLLGRFGAAYGEVLDQAVTCFDTILERCAPETPHLYVALGDGAYTRHDLDEEPRTD